MIRTKRSDIVNKDFENIIAVYPIYENGTGDIVKVIWEDKTECRYVKMRSFMESFLKYHYIDYASFRKRFGDIVGVKNLIPILADDDIYIPFKARKTVSKNDSSFGYYSLKNLKDIKRCHDGTEIHLKNGIVLNSVAKIHSNKKHLREARIIFELKR